MFVQQHIKKILISGLVAGALAFGGMYMWNTGQGIATDSGDGGGSPKIATTGTGGQVIDRD
ncbi:MAG: hypothetical protein AAGF95_30645 [Chloroflexota bacterium]